MTESETFVESLKLPLCDSIVTTLFIRKNMVLLHIQVCILLEKITLYIHTFYLNQATRPISTHTHTQTVRNDSIDFCCY